MFDPDVIRTRSLLIWSQTRYRCATESRCVLEPCDGTPHSAAAAVPSAGWQNINTVQCDICSNWTVDRDTVKCRALHWATLHQRHLYN